MHRSVSRYCLVVLLLGHFVAVLPAQEWTRFRGPNGDGVSQATTVPAQWDDDDYNWIAELPGEGHSSPVIWGNKVFVTSAAADAGKRYVLCLDTVSGKILWKHAFDFTPGKKNKHNSYASSTQAVDQDLVFSLLQDREDSHLLAHSHDGKLAWKVSLPGLKEGHGTGVSLMIHEGAVILPDDQTGESSLRAFNTKTGKPLWTLARKSSRTSYSTPCVFQPKGQPAEIIFTEMHHGITGVDPKTGKIRWEISVFGTFKQRAIGSPVVYGDLVIGTSGFTTAEKNVVAVRPGYAGEKATVKEVYRISKTAPHIPTPLVYKDRMYLLSDRGLVASVNAATGEQVWLKRIGGNYYSSPVCANGKLYCLDDSGEMIVLATSDDYEVLGEISIGKPSRATPAISDGIMYIRTESHLLSLGGKK